MARFRTRHMRINPLLKFTFTEVPDWQLYLKPYMYIWRLHESESCIKIAPSICYCSLLIAAIIVTDTFNTSTRRMFISHPSRHTSHSFLFDNIKPDTQLLKRKPTATVHLHLWVPIYERRWFTVKKKRWQRLTYFFRFERKVLL